MNIKVGVCLLVMFCTGCTVFKQAEDSRRNFYEKAIEYFSNGQFLEAEKWCLKMLRKDPENWKAHLLLANIAYMQNDLSKAESELKKVISIIPHNPKPKFLLAMIYYKQNQFRKSARLFSEIGQFAKAEMLLKIESPYLIKTKNRYTIIDFEIAFPLPVIEATVNGNFTTFFLIDTTRAEVSLTREFAKKAGIKILSREVGSFLGIGKQTIAFGNIQNLELGEFLIYNVPAVIQEHKSLKQICPDIQIEGIIGVNLLYQFLATLDFKNECLILRKKEKKVLAKFESKIKKKSVVIPFWMAAGGHFILLSGSINTTRPMLFLLSTGLAGCDFTGPDSVLKETGIKIENKKMLFGIEKMVIGKLKARNLIGAKGIFPSQLEYLSGVRICGIVSHRFFGRSIITFDFMNFRIFVEPPTEPV